MLKYQTNERASGLKNLTALQGNIYNLQTEHLTVGSSVDLPDDSLVLNADGQIETADPDAVRSFHGWWGATVRGIIGEFGDHTACNDAYIFIDASTNPLRVTSMGGNGKDIRYPNPFEGPDGQLFTVLDDTTLSSINNDNPLQLQDWGAIKMQADGNSIVVQRQVGRVYKGVMQPAFASDGETVQYYRRIAPNSMQTQLMPKYDELDYRFTDYTQPTELFKYVFNTYLYQLGILHPEWNSDFVGFYEAHRILDDYLSAAGRTMQFVINKMRVTRNGSGVTDVYYHLNGSGLITPGSTVTISGLGGNWAALANGQYVNGVSKFGWGGVPNPRDTHVDYTAVGGFMGYLGHFYLDLDSSSLAAGPDYYAAASQAANPPHWDAAGVARSAPHWGATQGLVSVTHRVTDDMEYPAFIAAVLAMYSEIFKVMTHASCDHFTLSSSDLFLPTSWATLKSALAAGTAFENTFDFVRISGIIPSRGWGGASFYASDIVPQFPSFTLNDPYGWNPTSGSMQDYESARNYVVGARNLYYSLAGPVTEPIHSVAGLIGYPNQSANSNGGSYFVGTTAPTDFTNPSAGNPDPSRWLLMGRFVFPTIDMAVKLHYFGFINPAYTPGKKIGYIRWGSTLMIDAFGLMQYAQFEPPGPVGPSGIYATGLNVYAEMMKYLLTSHPTSPGLDAIILDNTSDIGGNAITPLWLSNLFGGDRPLLDGAILAWRDNENRAPERFTDLGLLSVNNIVALSEASASQIRPSDVIARSGPDAVFQNGKLIIINDNAAISGGDVTPQYYWGAALDRNLGGGVTMTMIGDTDGRLTGSHGGDSHSWPLQAYSERLKDQDGNPVSGLAQLVGDPFPSSIKFNGVPSTLQSTVSQVDDAVITGIAGGAPLANELEETLYLDTGLMGVPHPDPPLPGWPGPNPPLPGTRTTWRYRWLEQAIRAV